VILLLLLLACQPGTDSGLAPLDWSFAFEITVTEYRSPGGSDASAWASVDNRESEAPPWELERASGDCGFYAVRPWRDCDPACEVGSSCTWDGECVEASSPIDAGIISVAGLEVALVFEPSSEWVYYGYDFEPEPSDGEIFAQGDPITASAQGAQLPAFELETRGVAPLESDLPCPIQDDHSGDLSLSWTPGQVGDRVRLQLASANHGSQFPAVICETEDDGALTVDAALVQAWQDTWLPVPSWRLERIHEASGEVAGVPVELQAQALEGCSW
jgi:hypothetical protein